MDMQYEVRYVASKANLADPPSRDDVSILQELGAVELPEWSFPHFGTGLDSWARSTHEAHSLAHTTEDAAVARLNSCFVHVDAVVIMSSPASSPLHRLLVVLASPPAL
eukprot:5191736-Pyramimonas_sp.AAC.1